MTFGRKLLVWSLALIVGFGITGGPTSARESAKTQHVVPVEELKQQTLRSAQARAENEAAVRHLLTSEAGQKVLQSAKIDYAQADRAISQLDEQELAKLADRSRQAENDFAAGFISAKTLAYIILAIVVIVVIAVLV